MIDMQYIYELEAEQDVMKLLDNYNEINHSCSSALGNSGLMK